MSDYHPVSGDRTDRYVTGMGRPVHEPDDDLTGCGISPEDVRITVTVEVVYADDYVVGGDKPE